MSKRAPDKSDSTSVIPVAQVSAFATANSSAFATANHAQEMAAILGLSIRPEWEDSVVVNLKLLELAAEQVLAIDLPDDIEPAVVFLAT